MNNVGINDNNNRRTFPSVQDAFKPMEKVFENDFENLLKINFDDYSKENLFKKYLALKSIESESKITTPIFQAYLNIEVNAKHEKINGLISGFNMLKSAGDRTQELMSIKV